MPSSRRSRRVALLLGVTLLVVLALWLLRRGGSPSGPPAPPGPRIEASATPRAPAEPILPDLAQRRLPAPAEQAGPPAAPIIDEIVLEKQEVCEGEENLVTVRAHTPGGVDDAYLRYSVDTHMGSRVALRSYVPDPEAEPPPRLVRVAGRNGVVTEAPLPGFTVKPCRPPWVLKVQHRNMPNTEAEFEFFARIDTESAGAPFRGVSYRWDFGDGESVVTPAPVVEHGYEGRAQDSLYSQYLVTCEATSDKGDKVVGRLGIEILNPEFENFAYKGILVLSVGLWPRFPVMDPRGVVEQRVRLWHTRPQAVTIERASLERFYRDGTPPVPAEEVDVERLLGTRTIASAGIEFTHILDTSAEPNVSQHTYNLAGTTADGYPAMGKFSIMRPPDRPTRENSAPVEDALLKAKILRARELLGAEFVTEEDLWRLDKEGKFDDLKAIYPPTPPQEGMPRPAVLPKGESGGPGR